ncbi:hypothetical protein GCM10010236_50040 [Streptomyces eurythermus]|nr:hypothetical protein GCM10010236_50040 [Streptomyces eurythermus]
MYVFSGRDGMRNVGGRQDGRQSERFEPGAAHSLTGDGPYELFPLVQAALTAPGSSGSRTQAAAAPPGRPAPSPAAGLCLGRPLGPDRRDQGNG